MKILMILSLQLKTFRLPNSVRLRAKIFLVHIFVSLKRRNRCKTFCHLHQGFSTRLQESILIINLPLIKFKFESNKLDKCSFYLIKRMSDNNE